MKSICLLASLALFSVSCDGPGNNPSNSGPSPDRTGEYAPGSSDLTVTPNTAAPDTSGASTTTTTTDTNSLPR